MQTANSNRNVQRNLSPPTPESIRFKDGVSEQVTLRSQLIRSLVSTTAGSWGLDVVRTFLGVLLISGTLIKALSAHTAAVPAIVDATTTANAAIAAFGLQCGRTSRRASAKRTGKRDEPLLEGRDSTSGICPAPTVAVRILFQSTLDGLGSKIRRLLASACPRAVCWDDSWDAPTPRTIQVL